MTFKIEKKVPVPSTGALKTIYPFREMEIGDSFLIEGDEKEVLKKQKAAIFCGKMVGVKTLTRRVPEGVRVWRIA